MAGAAETVEPPVSVAMAAMAGHQLMMQTVVVRVEMVEPEAREALEAAAAADTRSACY